MEIIAISSEGPTMESQVDPRFGRAAGFIVINPASDALDYLDNGMSQAMAQGAGIQAAERIIQSGAKVLLTGYVGPKAFQVLHTAGVKVIQDMGSCTAQEALEKYNSGQLTAASKPNRQGHWK